MKATIYLIAFFTALYAVFPQIPINHSVTSTKGNIELTVTNNGMVGHKPVTKKSGFIWPRGSNAQYLFGGGFILLREQFAAGPTSHLPEYSYNFMDATSWFVPGAIVDSKLIDSSKASKYRVYNSSNYDKYSGQDLSDQDAPRWPIWTDYDYIGAYYGDYKVDESERTRSLSKPLFKSDEDLVAIYKDSDTNVNIVSELYNNYISPIGIEAETRVYSYVNEAQKNVVFINWVITNNTANAIKSLSFAPVFDIDITKVSNAFTGIDNDIIIYPEDSSYVSFATELEEYEEGEDFGYISFKWLETPLARGIQIDYNYEYTRLKVLGYRQLPNEYDYLEYWSSFISRSENLKQKTDQRFFMPTIPFVLPANQSASFVIQINMTPPNKDYPNMDNDTRKKIEAELEANEIFFKERLTSVEVTEEQSPISVYPNPTKDGKINVELDVPIGEQMTIELFDLAGNTLSTVYQGLHHKQLYELNLGKNATGTYLLRFTIGDKIYSKKFVVGG
ncbi:MAG: T9SS type A sorting domain-containing protein [Candidatus Kapaibacterium sp.]